jgi:enoyl-[acyl-carrier protein] reductase II
MVSAAESPIHENWKNAIVSSPETGTVFLKSAVGPSLRALRTERTERLAGNPDANAMAELAGGVKEVYFGGNLEAGVALTGEIAGRIESIAPVSAIIEQTAREFFETVQRMAKDVNSAT